jgi:hypothetical protein
MNGERHEAQQQGATPEATTASTGTAVLYDLGQVIGPRCSRNVVAPISFDEVVLLLKRLFGGCTLGRP